MIMNRSGTALEVCAWTGHKLLDGAFTMHVSKTAVAINAIMYHQTESTCVHGMQYITETHCITETCIMLLNITYTHYGLYC